jgi:predicted AAA+ superfamily ATPase
MIDLKPQVKSPKIHVQDSGILHALLLLPSLGILQGHPKLGSSWEGFALQEVLSVLETHDSCFWQTHAGAELDLLVMTNGKPYGFEFKRAQSSLLARRCGTPCVQPKRHGTCSG